MDRYKVIDTYKFIPDSAPLSLGWKFRKWEATIARDKVLGFFVSWKERRKDAVTE